MKFSTTGQEKDDLLKQVTDSLRGDHLGRSDFSYSIVRLGIWCLMPLSKIFQ
jgi:hypothetical protein